MVSLREKVRKMFSGRSEETPAKTENAPYYSLTPDNNIENGEEYFRALDWALEQEDIKNIAISGPYGSGKSSVIESYLNFHKEIKPLRISMAAFNLKKDEEIDENELQTGILKQLFYSTSAEKIPDSRYRKLVPEKKLKTFLSTVLVEAIIVILLCLFSLDHLSDIRKALQILPVAARVIIVLAVFAIGYFGCQAVVRWAGKQGHVKKISFGSASVDASEDYSDSIFNKNMDEIIYFFERRKPQIVIFEDLDRFDNTKIFSALRELNTILNNYENISHRVTFIYAIRDDLFTRPDERTKFFDFIIPIVPYISSTNSEDILRKLLYIKDDTNKSSKYDIDGAYISLVSPYISDMRTLENICNEFLILSTMLKKGQEIGLEEKKILSMIIFKNLYPKEFVDIENETSNNLMKLVFEGKSRYIEEKKRKVEEQQASQEKRLEEVKKDAFQNIRELKICTLFKLTDEKGIVYRIDFNGQTYNLNTILSDSFDIKAALLDSSTRIIYRDYNGSNYTKQPDVESCKKYLDRVDWYKDGVQAYTYNLRKGIEILEQQIHTLNALSLQEIVSESDNLDFLDEKVRSNDLLIFLLRQGFIDEDFSNYINYFHPNSITKDEMNFILGIRNHRWTEPYSYPLQHVSQVYSKLQDYELKQMEALNFDLVDYVLVNEQQTSAADYLFSQLASHSKSSMAFVKAYFNRGENIPIFIEKMCQDTGFWNAIAADAGISEDTEYKYLVAIFNNASVEDVVAQNQPAVTEERLDTQNSPLLVFIISHVDILQRLKDVPTAKVIEIIQQLDIVFVNVDIEDVDDGILQDIFENDRYELSLVMIGKLFEWKAPGRRGFLAHQSYTQILSLQYQPLLNYVHNNFELYIKDNVLSVEENTEETVESVNDILERLIDQEDLCYSILDKEKVIWEDISDCCAQTIDEDSERKKEIWKYLLNNDRIFCNWDNVARYYETYGNDEAWVNYFERNADSLLEDIENPVVSDAIISELTLSDIAIDHYQSIVSSNRFSPYDGSLNGLNPEKIRVLIEEGKLLFSKRYWNEMRQSSPEFMTLFASSQPEKFMSSFSEISPTEKEIEELIQENSFSVEDRKKMLLGLKYSSLSEKSADIISRLQFSVPREYFDGAWILLGNGARKQILLNQMGSLTNDELPKYFQQMGDEYQGFTDRTRRHKFRLEASEYNKALTNKLFEKGYISSREEKRELLENKKGTRLVIEGYIKAAG